MVHAIQQNYHRERFAARKLPRPGLTIIKQSTRHYNTGNLLEKRASAGNYDAPSPSTYVGAEEGRGAGEKGGRGKLTKFRLLVLVRYNLWPLAS